jgi:hypothetical protein
MRLDEGEVWSAIRAKLPDVTDRMKEAVEADRYETMSAILDDIARKLAAAVMRRAEMVKGATVSETPDKGHN